MRCWDVDCRPSQAPEFFTDPVRWALKSNVFSLGLICTAMIQALPKLSLLEKISKSWTTDIRSRLLTVIMHRLPFMKLFNTRFRTKMALRLARFPFQRLIHTVHDIVNWCTFHKSRPSSGKFFDRNAWCEWGLSVQVKLQPKECAAMFLFFHWKRRKGDFDDEAVRNSGGGYVWRELWWWLCMTWTLAVVMYETKLRDHHSGGGYIWRDLWRWLCMTWTLVVVMYDVNSGGGYVWRNSRGGYVWRNSRGGYVWRDVYTNVGLEI